jgi:hypothetical protein
MTRYMTRDRAALAAAVVAPLAAAAILVPFRSSWPNTNVALLVVVVVVIVAVAAIGNRVAGAVAAIGAAVWFDFSSPCPMSGSPSPARDHRRAVPGADPQDRGAAQTARSPDDVVDHVRDQLVGLLDLHACRIEHGNLLGHPPRLQPDGTVATGRGRWDVEQAGLPGEEIELRVFAGGQYYGRFMMRPKPGYQAVPAGPPDGRRAGRQAGRAAAAAALIPGTG